MAVGSEITAAGYNAIRSKIVGILGPGLGQSGYGQNIVSTSVSAGNDITAAHWEALRNDLLSIKRHQDGTDPSLITVSTGDVIRFGTANPNSSYDLLADQAIADKFDIGTGQYARTSKASQTNTSTWNTQAQCTLNVTFPSSDDARWFFNSGGKLVFKSTFLGTTATPQNNSWNSLLIDADDILFGAITPIATNFYTLTTSYQTVYQRVSSIPYTSNYFLIEVLSNCTDATNVNGTADVLTFRFTWGDDYTDPGLPTPPGDEVDGTLSLFVSELKTTSILSPLSSPFIITSPSYSLSSITTS